MHRNAPASGARLVPMFIGCSMPAALPSHDPDQQRRHTPGGHARCQTAQQAATSAQQNPQQPFWDAAHAPTIPRTQPTARMIHGHAVSAASWPSLGISPCNSPVRSHLAALHLTFGSRFRLGRSRAGRWTRRRTAQPRPISFSVCYVTRTKTQAPARLRRSRLLVRAEYQPSLE